MNTFIIGGEIVTNRPLWVEKEVKKYFKFQPKEVKNMCTENTHTEQLLNFFNFELSVGGEYPFYTDDRILLECGTLQKKVYRNGRRRTINVPPVSLHTKNGVRIAETISDQIYKQEELKAEQINKKQSHDQFINFVVNNWEILLTKQQKQFVKDSLENNADNYTKQQRYQFRNNIQKRLKIAFIGTGGESVSIHKLAELRLKLDLINRFIAVSDDNKQFANELIKNLDREYISEIVYDRMTPEAQLNIVAGYQGKENIKTIYLYQFFEILLADKEKFEKMGLI